MRKVCWTVAAGFLSCVVAQAGAGPATVMETVMGTPGDWTYTYTLTNNGTSAIWTWGVWFPADPQATSVTVGDANWTATAAQLGYFPQQYVNEGYAQYVYDSTADPFHPGTPNPLVGPNGEPGYYSAYASDYMTSNPGQYWDGSAWQALPSTEPGYTDPLWDKFWRGSKYGYDFGWTEGTGGNVQTSYGVGPGGTSQIVVNTPNAISGVKSFSYNTTGYYYSIADWNNATVYTDFEKAGTVVPEPVSILSGVIGLTMVRVWVGRKRRSR